MSKRAQHDALYKDVKQFFTDSISGTLTVASVATLTRYAMEVVQTGRKWKSLRGAQKRELVLGVISALVKDLLEDPKVVGENFDEGSKQAILAALAFAPMLIDAAVGFAKTYHGNKSSGGRPRPFCC